MMMMMTFQFSWHTCYGKCEIIEEDEKSDNEETDEEIDAAEVSEVVTEHTIETSTDEAGTQETDQVNTVYESKTNGVHVDLDDADKGIKQKERLEIGAFFYAPAPKKMNKVVHTIYKSKHTQQLKKLCDFLTQGGQSAIHNCKQLMEDLEPDIAYLKSQKLKEISHLPEDHLGTSLLPQALEAEFKAIRSTANGNCFFNSLSLLKFGNEEAAPLFRLLTAAELYVNAKKYEEHKKIILPAKEMRRDFGKLFPDALCIDHGQDEWYENNNQVAAIQREAVNISKNGTHVPLLAFLGVANVMGQNVFSVYPEIRYKHRRLFHQEIKPFDASKSQSTMHILWTVTKLDNSPNRTFVPNHFVPLA